MTTTRETLTTAMHRPHEEARTLRWSPLRVAGGFVLAAWASLFWFLLLTERTQLYLSSRTAWLVPLGAVLATLAAVGCFWSARVERPESLSTRETWMLGLITLPVVVLIALPPASLDSFAVGKRSVFAAGVVGDVSPGAPIDMITVAMARGTQTGRDALQARAGEIVTLEGFASGAGSGDEISLTRFVITCCVADAVSSYVTVVNVPPGSVADDQWLSVTGRIYPLGNEILVDATEIHEIEEPEHPYLTG